MNETGHGTYPQLLKGACEGAVCHVGFGASLALEREEGAEQIVGNRDHGEGEGIQTGEAGLKSSRSVRREGVCAGDECWGTHLGIGETAVPRREGPELVSGKYWRTEKQQSLAGSGATTAQRRHPIEECLDQRGRKPSERTGTHTSYNPLGLTRRTPDGVFISAVWKKAQ